MEEQFEDLILALLKLLNHYYGNIKIEAHFANLLSQITKENCPNTPYAARVDVFKMMIINQHRTDASEQNITRASTLFKLQDLHNDKISILVCFGI